MTSDPREQRAREVAADFVFRWVDHTDPHHRLGAEDELARALLAERRAGMEECAKIADARAADDQALWKDEVNWSQPYASNRVVRASMDIAATIRALAAGKEGT